MTMKKLLIIMFVAIVFLPAPFVVWRLCDNPESRKIEPLIGKWRTTAIDGVHLRIFSAQKEYRITVLRPDDSRRGHTYRLHYDFCIHYMDDAGRRTDIFYTPAADAMLLMPGGKTFTRITESRNHVREQNHHR